MVVVVVFLRSFVPLEYQAKVSGTIRLQRSLATCHFCHQQIAFHKFFLRANSTAPGRQINLAVT